MEVEAEKARKTHSHTSSINQVGNEELATSERSLTCIKIKLGVQESMEGASSKYYALELS